MSEENGRERLFKALSEHIEPFLDQYESPYAIVKWNGKREICSINGRKFFNYLITIAQQKEGSIPTKQLLESAVFSFSATAYIGDNKHPLSNRIAVDGEDFIYGLGEGRSVLISQQDVLVRNNADTWFRDEQMSPQFEPDLDNPDLSAVLDFGNIDKAEQKLLFLVTLVSCFIPNIYHPAIVFHGHQGSGKSSMTKLIKRLVDPSADQLKVFPGNQYELGLQFAQSYMVCYDNLVNLTTWQSNLICQQITGGNIEKKENYADTRLVKVNFQGCIVFNGINLVTSRPDLLDRCVIFELHRIKQFKEDSEFWQLVDQAIPRILGGVFRTLSKAMELYPEIKCESLSRLADFHRWGCAIAEAMGYTQQMFIDAYAKNKNRSSEHALAENPVARAITIFAQDHPEWHGTVAELHYFLSVIAEKCRFHCDPRWPKSANKLWGRINEVLPDLEVCGIRVKEGEKTNTGKMIYIEVID